MGMLNLQHEQLLCRVIISAHHCTVPFSWVLASVLNFLTLESRLRYSLPSSPQVGIGPSQRKGVGSSQVKDFHDWEPKQQ